MSARLSAAIAELGMRLLQQRHPRPDGANLIAPLGIAHDLALLANGAYGPTRAEMTALLQTAPNDLAALNREMEGLLQALAALRPEPPRGRFSRTARPSLALELANGLWLRAAMPTVAAFYEICRTLYQTEIGHLQSAEAINRWVAEQTHGQIERVIERIDPLDLLIVVSAVAFRGSWLQPFAPSETRLGSFVGVNRTNPHVPLMSAHDLPIAYSEDERFIVAALPLGQQVGQPVAALLCFVPRDPSDFRAAGAALNAERWSRLVANLRKTTLRADLSMPKFSLTAAFGLGEHLQALGMRQAMRLPGADFRGLSSAPIRISEIRHCAALRVDEAGVEASASTTTRLSTLGFRPPDLELRIERAFYAALVDWRSWTPLMLAEIADL